MIVIIMNTQQTTHNAISSPPNDWFTVSPRAAIAKRQTHGFGKFCKTPEKDWTPGQERTQTQGKEQRAPCPSARPTPKLSTVFMVWSISNGQLGCLPGCAPSQLLHTCSLAEHEKLEEALDFLATTKNHSVTNILLVLNPKHSSYWQEK